MYQRILVPLENTATDAVILEHVRGLATFCKASVVLIHVADGFVARNYKPLALRESEEMRADREYLERCAQKLCDEGIDADSLLAGGDPAIEITAAAEREGCDLIAMATHGHSMLGDVMHGTTATALRHVSRIPILMVRAPAPGPGESR